MISAQWTKVLSDITTNLTRTVLIVLSISVGLFAMGAILSSRVILGNDMERSYARINPSSGILRISESFDEDFIASVRRMDGVVEADGRRSVQVRVLAASGKWLDLRIFAVEDYRDMKINKIFPQTGAFPPGKKQALIERSAVEMLGLGDGDTLLVETPDEKRVSFTVAGTVHDMVQMPAQFDGTPYAYISFDSLRSLGEPQKFNELAVVSERPKDEKYNRAVMAAVKDKAEKSGYSIPLAMSAEAGVLPLDSILQAILLILGVLGTLSLFLSVFLIINTFSALILQQMRQIGVMKAVGAEDRQIMSMYLVMVLAYGLLALVIAVPLGMLGAQGLSQMMAGMFNFDLVNLRPPLEVVLVQILTGLLIPLAAAAYPLFANLRGTAAQAMNAENITHAGAGSSWFDRLYSGAALWRTRFVLLRTYILSLRNTFRSKGRLALTLVTLTLAGAVFISVFSVQASLMASLEDLLRLWGFDVMVSFDKDYRVEYLREKALQVPGVETMDIWLTAPSRMIYADGSESHMIYLFAPEANSSIVKAPYMIEGRWLHPQDEHAVVVNSNFMKDEPDVDVGDQITLKINGSEEQWTVVGVSLGMGAPMLYTNYDFMAQKLSGVGKASTMLLALNEHTPQAVERLSDLVEAHLRRQGLHVSSMVTMAQERAEMEASFSILVALLLIMALMLALVGGLGLMGTMSINVIERTREIGVLRAVGASNRSVRHVFVRESMFIGFISWMLSSLTAVVLGRLLSDAVGDVFLGTPLSYTFSLPGMIGWLALVLGLSYLASVVPARSAARLTVREVLAYE